MRRFNYEDNDEYREDVDKFFNEEKADIYSEDYQSMLEEEHEIQQLQIKFVYRDWNQKLLRISIRTCEKSFWWRFLFQNTRLKMIEQTYRLLKKIEEEE